MTLQNISRADFCDVVSVLPCSPTNKGKQNIFDAVRKKLIDREKSRSPSWLFDCHRCWARNIKKAAACELIGAKKGAIFSLIYLFESICLYYIPHNYVIPQAMPHAIPQTHPPFTLTDDCLNKTKVVKASKLSQSETRETFSEFECIRNVLFTSKIQFLKVKSALNPDELRFTNGRR